MTGAELLALTRELLRDEKTPYLWSDSTIYKYLNDAQRTLAERTHCVVDDENYEVQLEQGVRSYTLDTEILSVLGAQIEGEAEPLRPGFSPVSSVFFAHSEGIPTNYSCTGGRGRMSFTPTPDDDYIVKLVVAIRPSTAISAAITSEIPLEYHTALADYAASRCLIHNDSDGLNAQAAENFGATFLEAVRDLKRQVYQYRLGPDANVVPMRIT